MGGRHVAIGAAILGMWSVCAHPALAQTSTDAERQALKTQIEQRFDVLPVQDGVVLRPKRPLRTVRSIQVTGGDIALDGELVTGKELRQRLGNDADLIVRLSYLSGADQRTLFGSRTDTTPLVAIPELPPAPAFPELPRRLPRLPRPPRPPREPGASDRVRIGGDIQVSPDEVVNGDVVAIGGDLNVNGQVRGDVVCVAGDAELGPTADVAGDVTVVAGTLKRDPAARIAGSVNEIGWRDLRFFPRVRRSIPGTDNLFGASSSTGRSVFAFFGTIARLVILCLLASLVFLFGRDYVERVGVRAAAEPLKAGLVGILIQILFLPMLVVTIVVLVVTIIGIPLLLLIPFALLGLAVVWLIGFTAVARDVGRFLAERMGWHEPSPYLITSIGIVGLLSPVLVAGLVGLGGGVLVPLTWTLFFIGFCVEYLAWTVGLGAVALLRFERR